MQLGHTYLNKIAWILIAWFYNLLNCIIHVKNCQLIYNFLCKRIWCSISNCVMNIIINSSRLSIFRGASVSDCSFAPYSRDLSASIPHTSRCPLNPGPTHATGGYQFCHHDQPPTPGVPYRQCGHRTDVQPLRVPLLPPACRYSCGVPYIYWTDGSRYVKFLRCAVNVD